MFPGGTGCIGLGLLTQMALQPSGQVRAAVPVALVGVSQQSAMHVLTRTLLLILQTFRIYLSNSFSDEENGVKQPTMCVCSAVSAHMRM